MVVRTTLKYLKKKNHEAIKAQRFWLNFFSLSKYFFFWIEQAFFLQILRSLGVEHMLNFNEARVGMDVGGKAGSW